MVMPAMDHDHVVVVVVMPATDHDHMMMVVMVVIVVLRQLHRRLLLLQALIVSGEDRCRIRHRLE